jgi:hypothetical protein
VAPGARARALAGAAGRAPDPDLRLRTSLADCVDVSAGRADAAPARAPRAPAPRGDLRLLARLRRVFA